MLSFYYVSSVSFYYLKFLLNILITSISITSLYITFGTNAIHDKTKKTGSAQKQLFDKLCLNVDKIIS